MADGSQAIHLLDQLRRQRGTRRLRDDCTTDGDRSIEEDAVGAVSRATHLDTERISEFRSRIA